MLYPNHGSGMSYKWERRNAKSSVWEPIHVPVYTCLLYVDDPGDYRCTLCDETYYFIVLWKGKVPILTSPLEVYHYYCVLYSRLYFIGNNDRECNDDGKCPA